MSCREDLIKIAQEVLSELGKVDDKVKFLEPFKYTSFDDFDKIDLKDINKEMKKEEKYNLTKDLMRAQCFIILATRLQNKNNNDTIEFEELCKEYTEAEKGYLSSKPPPPLVEAKVMDKNDSSNAAGQAIAVRGIQEVEAEVFDPYNYNHKSATDAGRGERKKGGKKTKHRRNKKTKRRRNRKTKLRRNTRK